MRLFYYQKLYDGAVISVGFLRLLSKIQTSLKICPFLPSFPPFRLFLSLGGKLKILCVHYKVPPTPAHFA